MAKEWLAEYLRRYHLGQFNATTSRELELSFGIKGIEAVSYTHLTLPTNLLV